VTAKHVLRRNPSEYYPKVFCRVNLRNWDPNSGSSGVQFLDVPILDSQQNLLWTVHSNPAVDIAVTQRFPNPETYDIQAVPTGAFLTQEAIQRNRIVEGQELFFPCFTPEIPQRNRNNPIIRFGRIALLSLEDFITDAGSVRVHLAECFPFGGNSGSPVFTRQRTSETEERHALFGIMTGYYVSAQPIIQQTQSGFIAPQHMGIASVVPVDYLNDILYNEALRRNRGEVS
jgi:hypothetical protein